VLDPEGGSCWTVPYLRYQVRYRRTHLLRTLRQVVPLRTTYVLLRKYQYIMYICTVLVLATGGPSIVLICV
jgi:hypothetical protein